MVCVVCVQWLAETVVVPVAAEIAKINQTLSKGSTPTIEIGGKHAKCFIDRTCVCVCVCVCVVQVPVLVP